MDEQYVAGIITDAHVDGSYAIEHDGGTREMLVARNLIEFV